MAAECIVFHLYGDRDSFECACAVRSPLQYITMHVPDSQLHFPGTTSPVIPRAPGFSSEAARKRNLEKRDANGLLYMQSPGEKQTHSQEKIRPSSHSWSWGDLTQASHGRHRNPS
ncbi:hypothetical protein FKM82_027938 [Ascaphus truei]